MHDARRQGVLPIGKKSAQSRHKSEGLIEHDVMLRLGDVDDRGGLAQQRKRASPAASVG
jgi:hypothetical protein